MLCGPTRLLNRACNLFRKNLTQEDRSKRCVPRTREVDRAHNLRSSKMPRCDNSRYVGVDRVQQPNRALKSAPPESDTRAPAWPFLTTSKTVPSNISPRWGEIRQHKLVALQ